jgi:putative methionine-R-sulfoxide reductase with GAF domain
METAESGQHYLNILSRFSSDLIKKSAAEDIFWAITENAISELGFEDCVVYAVNESGKKLVQKAAFGPKSSGEREILDPIEIPVGSGIVGHVAFTGEAEIINDCSEDPRYIEDDQARNSEIAVPIIKDGKVIGVIDSEHREKGYYTEEHLTVLRAIAHITALRLSQIKFRQSVEKHRDKLEVQVEAVKDELQTTLYELRRSNEQLEKLVVEKNEMLKELHHRIKNQMQTMHSLINLQSVEVDNDLVKENLLICMNRVRCMGLVYQMAEGLTIDIAQYLRAMNEELLSAYDISSATSFKVHTSISEIHTEKAVILGFILVDLFTSGVKQVLSVDAPSSSISLEMNDHCKILFESNWWNFEQVGELTDVFIAQIGAERLDSDSGLELVCNM